MLMATSDFLGSNVQFHASFWTLAGNCHPVLHGSVSPLKIDARVEAAARAGYRGISFALPDLIQIRQSPQWANYRSLRSLLDSNGMVEVELDLISDWFLGGPRGHASDVAQRYLLTAAEELGAHHIKVVGDMNHEVSIESMAEPLADLCVRAASAGTRVGSS